MDSADYLSQYLMDVTDHADDPREPTTQFPNVCFNPYLESALAYGTVSNCVACHQRAKMNGTPDLSGVGKPQATVNRRIDRDDEYYNESVRLDYVWSPHP